MSLEAAIAELTAAVKENTEAHAKLAEVAMAAQGAKPAPAKKAPAKAAPKEEAPKDEAPEEKPAPKKRAPRKKKVEPPTLEGSVKREDFMVVARTFMSVDDEEQRDKNKANFAAALDHLGAAKLSGLDDDDLPRLAGYVAYWNAGLEVKFEEIDELVAELADDEDEGSGEEPEDMLD